MWFFSDYDCSNGTNGTNSSQGIMGLAYAGLSYPPAAGYIDAANQQLASGFPTVFATQLCQTDGTIWFGGFDSTHTNGSPPQYTPITVPGDDSGNDFYWVQLNDIQLNGVSINESGQYYDPLVDTGTSIALFTPNVFNQLQTLISGNSNFQNLVGAGNAANWFSSGTSCFTAQTGQEQTWLSNLPTISLVMPSTTSGQTITVTLPATLSYLDSHVIGGVKSYCPGIGSNGSAQTQTIIGGSFLRSLVTIFDRGNSKIGFVPGANCSS